MSEVIKLISTASLKTNKFLTGFWNWDYVLWHCTYLRKSGDFWQKPFWNLPHGRVLQVVWRSSLSGPLNAFPIMKECSRAGTYFNCIMFMVASSVVTTIMILNYHHRLADTHEMPNWVRDSYSQWCWEVNIYMFFCKLLLFDDSEAWT